MKSTDYWTVSYGINCRIGFSCRECKKLIPLHAEIAVRDGRKMRLFYHRECFSEQSDPRTQQNSSFQKICKGAFQEQAPAQKGRGKWSVATYGYEPNYSTMVKVRKEKPSDNK